MYDVCIADDEVLIRQSIAARIRESGLPLRVLGSAANAESALRLYWSARPDIFLVDINMPGMDGLSLVRGIREEDPGCSAQFIIITGYDDFAHLREAIQSGVIDYLKKPIPGEEFTLALSRAITRIRQERAKHGAPKDGSAYYEDYAAGGTRLFTGGLMLALYAPAGETLSEGEARVTGALAQAAGEPGLFLRFRNTPGAALWYCPGKAVPRGDLAAALASFREQARGCAVYAYPDMEPSEALLERLEQSLNLRFIRPGGGLFIEAFPKSLPFSADLGLLDYALENGNMEEAAHAAEALAAKTAARTAIGGLCPLYRQIALLFISKYIDHNIPMPPALKLELSPFALCRFPDLQALRAFLSGSAASLAEAVRAERPRGDLIGEVIEYLRQRYRDGISLNTLAREFFVTPPYLSRRFREKTGLTFVEYLEELRLEKAEEYLLASDAKIIDIAGQVGYLDPNYFAKVFKKKYGLSPSDYRAASRSIP